MPVEEGHCVGEVVAQPLTVELRHSVGVGEAVLLLLCVLEAQVLRDAVRLRLPHVVGVKVALAERDTLAVEVAQPVALAVRHRDGVEEVD